MTLSIAIMAHPSRRAFVDELIEAVDIPAEVVWDRCANEWDTGRRAWEAHDPAATHHLVLQDDAIVCLDLAAGTERALPHAPVDSAVSLYVGTRRPQSRAVSDAAIQADLHGSAWIAMRTLNWGVGVVLPTTVISDLLAWANRQPDPNYDTRISRWLSQVMRWPTWCTWPSLVDHRPGPSLLNHVDHNRHARRFIGADRSALDIDWTAGVTDMAGLEALRR